MSDGKGPKNITSIFIGFTIKAQFSDTRLIRSVMLREVNEVEISLHMYT